MIGQFSLELLRLLSVKAKRLSTMMSHTMCKTLRLIVILNVHSVRRPLDGFSATYWAMKSPQGNVPLLAG